MIWSINANSQETRGGPSDFQTRESHDADWQKGHSKIFIRRELSEKLERLTKLKVDGREVAERRLASGTGFNQDRCCVHDA